jgi:fructose-1,6-bisphosphatase/inositol monophosphatase family enzyme
MNQNDIYLKVAVEAAKSNARLFLKNFGSSENVEMKDHDFRNLVTETDKQIETAIRKKITKKFPTHKIIGEEHAKDLVNKKDLVWIIDPIDGTTNYIQGLPMCCISIALWDNKGPLAGVVFNPILNQMFTAIRGQGAKLNSKIIHSSKENRLPHGLGGIGWINAEKGAGLFSVMAQNCRKLRVLASSAWQICLVGSGNYDFYVTGYAKIWDFAAAVLIAQEAGGKITDISGRAINLKTENIHNQILKILKSPA